MAPFLIFVSDRQYFGDGRTLWKPIVDVLR
jgi:hypothetical protein